MKLIATFGAVAVVMTCEVSQVSAAPSLDVGVSPVRETYHLGEPVELQLSFRNTGDEDVDIHLLYPTWMGVGFTVADVDPAPPSSRGVVGSIITFPRRLAPGEEYSRRIALARRLRLQDAKTYTVDFVAANAGFRTTGHVQALLSELASPRAQDRERFGDDSEKYLATKLAELEKLVDGRHDRLVTELLRYTTQNSGIDALGVSSLVIQRLGISKRSYALGALPLVDSETEGLRAGALGLLRVVEQSDDTPGPDFSTYEQIIRDRETDPPLPLIEHMYGRDPERALATMATVYVEEEQTRDLIAQAQAVSQDTLDLLSRQDEWWVRLYAAEVMSQRLEYRDAEIIQRLANDEHPLVRETAEELPEP